MSERKLIPQPLDEEEEELASWLNQVTTNELDRLEDPEFKKTKKAAEVIAKNTLKKKPVNVRLYEMDIKALKSMAAQDGIPYQTLLSSVVHKYVNGTLVPVRYTKSKLKQKFFSLSSQSFAALSAR